MSYYSEQDPLLPKDAGAPEIQGSRPQSIKNVGAQEAEVFEDVQDDNTQRRKILGDIMPLIFGLCLLLSFVLIFLPEDILGDRRPVPRTIEQRVNRILTDTPLIGILTSKRYK
jgi:membrane dipeptidase